MVEFQSASRQAGATLFVGLIMLVMMSLLGVSAMRMGSTNTQIVGNEQNRNEAEAAANFALDRVVNDVAVNSAIPAFMNSFTTVYNNAPVIVDVGQEQYSIPISTPVCIRARRIPSSALVRTINGVAWVDPALQPCISGDAMSNCAFTLWNMSATAAGGGTATMVQGVEITMNWQTAQNLCP